MDPRVLHNIAANLVGRGWVALVTLAFVPQYLRFLGAEAYGLIGVFATLSAASALLDAGSAATLNREIARLGEGPSGDKVRGVVRTLSVPCWALGGLAAVGLAAASPWIAREWLSARALTEGEVAGALSLMGVALLFQVVAGYYGAGLLGLERQGLQNLLAAGFATLRAAGAVFLLWAWSADVLVFFGWQAAASALHALAMRAALDRCMPPAAGAVRLDWRAISGAWRFAAGMTGVTAVSIVLMQSDRLLLSRLLTLEGFGHYALAALLAQSLQIVVSPFFTALYPRFSALVAAGRDDEFRDLYHRSSQLLAVAVLPTAAALALFSPEIAALWTGDPAIAAAVHPLVSVLALGTALNGLMNVPYAAQLAHGWPGFALRQNLVAVAVLVPALFALVDAFGAMGGAMAWALLNSGYVLVALPVMHRHLLRGELGRWYLVDVGAPLLAGLGVVVAWRLAVPFAGDGWFALAPVAAAGATGLLAAGAAAPAARAIFANLLRQRLTTSVHR